MPGWLMRGLERPYAGVDIAALPQAICAALPMRRRHSRLERPHRHQSELLDNHRADGRHQRAATIVAVHRQGKICRLLPQIKIVEGLLVDVP